MNIMLDLETLSSKPNAAIVAIGACSFGKEGVHQKFYAPINPQSSEDHGLHISASTFAWWTQQSAEARALFAVKDAASLGEGLDMFSRWCVGANALEMWGNGADFDCAILGHAYDVLAKTRPWKYSNNRCFRTLKSLVSKELNAALWTQHSVGLVHHNALGDAVRQALTAAKILRRLRPA